MPNLLAHKPWDEQVHSKIRKRVIRLDRPLKNSTTQPAIVLVWHIVLVISWRPFTSVPTCGSPLPCPFLPQPSFASPVHAPLLPIPISEQSNGSQQNAKSFVADESGRLPQLTTSPMPGARAAALSLLPQAVTKEKGLKPGRCRASKRMPELQVDHRQQSRIDRIRSLGAAESAEGC